MRVLSSLVGQSQQENSRCWGYVFVRVTMWCLASLMVMVLLGNALLSTRPNWHFLPRLPLPLEDVQDVIADSRGRVFIGLGTWSRVQVYDCNGQYLFRFGVDVNGGAFRLKLDDKQQIIVAAARREKWLLVYSGSGTPQSAHPDANDTFSQLYHRQAMGFVDENGSTYHIRFPILWPLVERIDKNGDVSLVISNPWYVFPVAGPLHTVVSLIALSMIGVFLRRKRQSR